MVWCPSLLEAGIATQTGTISVERYWLGEKIDLLSTVGRSLMEQCSNGLSTDATEWAVDGIDWLTGDVFHEPLSVD